MRLRLLARRDTVARDVQFAVAAFAAGLVLLGLRFFATMTAADRPSGAFALTLLAMCVALGLRRVAPVHGLLLGVFALGADAWLGGSIGTMLVFTQVLYEVCVHGPPWLCRWALRVSVAVTLAGTAAAMVALRTWAGAAVGVLCALVLLLPVFTAITVRGYRDQAAAERVRAEQTTRLAELALIAERTRMARDLHDVIANHLSAVAIHASALLSVPDLDRSDVRRAVRVIRENSVHGLAEMRRMVELLRDPGHRMDGRPSLSDVDILVAAATETGVTARLTVTGQPRALPAGVDVAGYRIIQESLTNALKHGAGPVDVTVDYQPDGVRLTVANPRDGRDRAVPGAGVGIVGMRERADLVGGRLTTGPDGDAWLVRADLPARQR